MLIPRGEIVSRLVITVFIGVTSFVGDNLLYSLKTPAFRAIADNLTHALVGGLSWTLIIKLSKKSVARNFFNIISCFLISSLIDLDHFLLARSWRLEDANHLGPKRPILHCSLIPVLVWLTFWICHNIFHVNSTLGCYIWVLITAFLSHHVRDATRRGMWFGFLGSTPPIPYFLYLFIAVTLPYFIYWLMPIDDINDDPIMSLVQAV